jgi:pimeloyl-ACP methyl ester carboxylesterase
VTATDQLLRPVLPSYRGSCRQRWLVLHGWAQGAPYWAPLARQLAADGITLLCPDMAELAASCQAPPGSLDRLLELTRRMSVLVSRHLGPEGVPVVVGHSSGAPAAVLLSHLLPGLSRLVLVEPPLHNLGMPGAVAPSGWSVIDSIGESVTDRLRSRYPFADMDTLRTIAAEITDAGAEPDISNAQDPRRDRAVYEALRTLPVPLLVVRGDRSALFSGADARTLVSCVPSAAEHVIPGAGHSVHMDQPRALAKVFAALMTEPGARASRRPPEVLSGC